MAITIKKSKMSLRASETVDTAAGTGETQTGRGPVLSAVAPPAAAPSYTVYAILGLVGALLFGALIFMQWMEFGFLENAFAPSSSAYASAPAPRPAAAAQPAPAAAAPAPVAAEAAPAAAAAPAAGQ